MNRIDEIFTAAREEGRKLLMPFVCAGSPAPGMLGPLLRATQDGGAGIVEVGFPFSDPIADGPAIASAMHTALGQGCTPERILDEVARTRGDLSIGVVAMVSVSIVEAMGGARAFCERTLESGFDGLIVPDCPLEESDALIDATRRTGQSLSLLISPTTPPERAAQIADACSGFVYMLARSGITGARDDAPEIGPRVAELRTGSDLPIACGFGIATPEHVRTVVEHADAAIVGSALVSRLRDAHERGADAIEVGRAFVRELGAGLT
ncbi:MAG: tryptophan synthase subunit alpha [Phycisphaerales bacterium JB059]